MSATVDLSAIIKSYDVRGVVGRDLNDDTVRAIGAAFADVVALPDGAPHVVIGRDMRDSGVALEQAFVRGLNDRGMDAVTIGLCSTDGLYHASGALDAPGAMITASHNPAEYNGIKVCRSRARAVGRDTGLEDMRILAERYASDGVPVVQDRGSALSRDMLAEYGAFLRSLVDLRRSRPLTVVVDAANGMAGLTVPAVLGSAAGLEELPLEIVPLYFDLDGTFPNHEANPLISENLRDLQAAVRAHSADIGLAFDGDADRCFVVDERGEGVNPSTITTLVGLREIAREQAAGRHPTVIHNLISSRAVSEQLAQAGATTVRAPVGHSNIKALMAQHDAVFGGEHSAHYYFRDFFFADTGMLAAMHVLAALGEQDRPLSEVVETYDPYVASGEINSTVADAPAAISRVRHAFEAPDVEIDTLDGLSVSHWDSSPQWWFNVRASNTEPMVRVNVEAAEATVMDDIRDRVLDLVRAEG